MLTRNVPVELVQAEDECLGDQATSLPHDGMVSNIGTSEEQRYASQGEGVLEVSPRYVKNSNYSVGLCKSGKNGMPCQGVFKCREEFDALFS